MSRSKTKPFVPELTVLESREVPAVASTRLFGGVLTVACDSNASSVLIYQTNRNITVRDIVTNRAWNYSSSQVGRVDVFGSIRGDTFTSRGPANARLVKIYGGAGADHLLGGNGREVLIGNAGADTIVGGGANDKLYGKAGDDLLKGGDGDDLLEGGEGENQIIGGAGADTMTGGSGRDTIVAIDGAATDIINPGEGDDFVWRDLTDGSTDQTDTSSGNDVVHDVDGFDNEGADTSLDGDEIPLPDPLSGDVYERFTNRPLFSPDGPSLFDINQGALGDCWMLAGIGSAAYVNPDAIRGRVVDFGDSTYGVHLGDKYYRVDNRLVAAQAGDQTLNYVSLGKMGSLWASVMEKAYTHFRMEGQNSYPSIEGGFSVDVFIDAFKSPDAQQVWFGHDATDQLTAAQHTAVIREMMDGGFAPTLGIDAVAEGVPLIAAHQYVVLDYTLNTFGLVDSIRVYNPWGIDSDGVAAPFDPNDPNHKDGIVTVTLAMLVGGIAGSYEFASVGPTALS